MLELWSPKTRHGLWRRLWLALAEAQQELGAEIPVGGPVRVHEEYYVIGGPFGWLNVVVRGGLGPVPAPSDPAAWAAEMTGGVQDLATGRALAIERIQRLVDV